MCHTLGSWFMDGRGRGGIVQNAAKEQCHTRIHARLYSPGSSASTASGSVWWSWVPGPWSMCQPAAALALALAARTATATHAARVGVHRSCPCSMPQHRRAVVKIRHTEQGRVLTNDSFVERFARVPQKGCSPCSLCEPFSGRCVWARSHVPRGHSAWHSTTGGSPCARKQTHTHAFMKEPPSKSHTCLHSTSIMA